MLLTEDTEICRLGEVLPSKETWALLDRSTRDEDSETEAVQDLYCMREDANAHLTATIVRHVIHLPEGEAAVQVVLPHLCRCSWCRGTLHQALALCGTEVDNPAYALLAEAEAWADAEAAGRLATASARQFLREHGANAVYAREGAIWEEYPDGTVHRVAKVACPEVLSL